MKYSPLIAGIAGAIALVLQQFLSQPEVDIKVILLAVLMAILGYLGTTLKGKGLTLSGIIGVVSYAAYTVYNSGSFSWGQFALTAIIAVLALIAPSAIPEKEPEP